MSSATDFRRPQSAATGFRRPQSAGLLSPTSSTTATKAPKKAKKAELDANFPVFLSFIVQPDADRFYAWMVTLTNLVTGAIRDAYAKDSSLTRFKMDWQTGKVLYRRTPELKAIEASGDLGVNWLEAVAVSPQLSKLPVFANSESPSFSMDIALASISRQIQMLSLKFLEQHRERVGKIYIKDPSRVQEALDRLGPEEQVRWAKCQPK